ncbi:MAG: isocitrate lyase/phosphoenolpyruvate mutase family protein, partial [Rhodospirillaceae bacterium]|nr:isocitrate lyase/phosphoenolpyruvate mutase family protein [Rhodospirillaceae bacterium]
MADDRPTQAEKAERFHALHIGDEPFILANAFDAGSARILAGLGFAALATTSGGFAGTLGRRDGDVTRDEAMDHARAVADAVDLPVSGDLENGFGHEPEDAARTVTLAAEAGLVGCSIEDYTGDPDNPFYDRGLAAERIAAAAEAARSVGFR